MATSAKPAAPPLRSKTRPTFFLLALPSAALFLFGCASKPTAPAVSGSDRGSAFGQWSGRGSASRTTGTGESKKVETWSFSLEVVSRTPGFGRIEIAGALGVYGGTIAWTPEETKILLPGRRLFVTAGNSAQAFSAILPFALSPSELEAIFFDRDFKFATGANDSRGIRCEKAASDPAGEAKETCKGKRGLLLERTRGTAEPKLSVATDTGAVKLELRPVKSKVQERDELWRLDAPSGFKKVDQRERL